jgi:hypothetical protein
LLRHLPIGGSLKVSRFHRADIQEVSMFKRLPYLPLIIVSLAMAAVAAGPAMATDQVPGPPAPPPQSAPPGAGVPALCVDNIKPSSRISTSAARAARNLVVRGTASDRGCGSFGRGKVAGVTVSVSRKRGGKCQFMSSKGRLSSAKSCSRPTWLPARGTIRWAFALPKHIGHGAFVVRTRALDSAGNVGLQRSLHVRIR